MPPIFSTKLSPNNILCLDTEFTDLTSPRLLSLGLASGSGAEHYAELDLQDSSSAGVVSRCSEFVRHCGVLEQWGRVPGSTGTYAQMAQRTADWLVNEAQLIQARSGQPAYIAFDYAPDFDLLVRLLRDGGHWQRVRPYVRRLDVSDFTCLLDAVLGAEAAFEALRRRGLAPHHALADALSLRAALHAAITGKRLML